MDWLKEVLASLAIVFIVVPAICALVPEWGRKLAPLLTRGGIAVSRWMGRVLGTKRAEKVESIIEETLRELLAAFLAGLDADD